MLQCLCPQSASLSRRWALTIFWKKQRAQAPDLALVECEVLTIPDGVEHDEWIQTAETTEEGCSTRC